jgi:hypothetical protein
LSTYQEELLLVEPPKNLQYSNISVYALYPEQYPEPYPVQHLPANDIGEAIAAAIKNRPIGGFFSVKQSTC